MILDKENMFDIAAAITVTRNSTNVIDLQRVGQNIGVGEPLHVLVTVPVLFTAGGSATLQVALVTDDNWALTSATVLHDQVAVIAVATLVAGYSLNFYVPPSALYERYLGLIYTVATGPMTAGTISAGILHDVQDSKSYPKNYVTA